MKTQANGGTPPPPKRKSLADRVYTYGAPASYRTGKGRRAEPPLPPGGKAGEREIERVMREVKSSEEKGDG